MKAMALLVKSRCSLTITVSNGGTLSESPADTGLLVDNGNIADHVDPSRLSDVLVAT
ncbi:hypothetical protein O9929_25050 [Vibrio lentus]|nr:hypothetical protein [Vibrio lentus]